MIQLINTLYQAKSKTNPLYEAQSKTSWYTIQN